MTDVLGLPPELVLLFCFSVAAGVDLYLAVLVVGLGFGLGFGPFAGGPALPFGGSAILVVLLCLYLAEFLVEFRPSLALLWHTLQLLLRPLAASLLGLTLLGGGSAGITLLGMGMAGAVAGFCHVMVWGRSISLRLMPRGRISLPIQNVIQDGAVLFFLLLSLKEPALGLLAGASFLSIGLLFGHANHGLVRFGLSLAVGQVWGIVSPPRWRGQEGLPPWTVSGTGLESFQALRGTRAGTQDMARRRTFKDGWLLERKGKLLFAYRRGWTPRLIQLDDPLIVEERTGLLAKTVTCRLPDGSSRAFFLQKGVPGPKSHKWP